MTQPSEDTRAAGALRGNSAGVVRRPARCRPLGHAARQSICISALRFSLGPTPDSTVGLTPRVVLGLNSRLSLRFRFRITAGFNLMLNLGLTSTATFGPYLSVNQEFTAGIASRFSAGLTFWFTSMFS